MTEQTRREGAAVFMLTVTVCLLVATVCILAEIVSRAPAPYESLTAAASLDMKHYEQAAELRNWMNVDRDNQAITDRAINGQLDSLRARIEGLEHRQSK
jgi:N12 class adenine-specific DNA methylase